MCSYKASVGNSLAGSLTERISLPESEALSKIGCIQSLLRHPRMNLLVEIDDGFGQQLEFALSAIDDIARTYAYHHALVVREVNRLCEQLGWIVDHFDYGELDSKDKYRCNSIAKSALHAASNPECPTFQLQYHRQVLVDQIQRLIRVAECASSETSSRISRLMVKMEEEFNAQQEKWLAKNIPKEKCEVESR